ncbi:MAG: DUF4339 domain-containing protein [Alloprevotella sp.]|nr:DUF4339 domain-containing protein [Alloprevotella sp.]
MNLYYYMDEAFSAQGPIDVTQLAARGVTGETLVWKEGMGDWVPASTLPDVADALASYVPPTVAPEPLPEPLPAPEPAPAPAVVPTPMPAPMPEPAPVPTQPQPMAPAGPNFEQNFNTPPTMNPQQYPGQPPGYSGYPYTQHPKKGGNTVLVAIICVLVTLILAGLAWFFFGRGGSSNEAKPAEPRHDTVIVREKETVIERQVPGTTTTTNTRVVPASPTQLKVTGTNVCLRLSPTIPGGADKYSNCLKYTNGSNVHPRKGEILPYNGESGDFYQTQYSGYVVYISKDFSQPM